MSVSETDLELVNAFHDGELEPNEAARFQRRLAADDELRVVFEEIREGSNALRAMKPETRALPTPQKAARRPATLAVASLILATILAAGILLFQRPDQPHSPLEWHNAFVAKSYDLAADYAPKPATKWIGQHPDLTSARLTLVDVAADLEGSFYLHYAGVNGCRLTFGVHSKAPDFAPSSASLLSDAWRESDVDYTLTAVGMDRNRFNAVAHLLREHTRIEYPVETTVMAVRRATRDAIPCA